MTRLDHLLRDVDDALTAWEDSPHSWSPGDPLWPHPTCTDDCYLRLDACTAACADLASCPHECDHQVVRPMVEEFHWSENAEVSLFRLSWCASCDVGWKLDEDPVCWVCGVSPAATWARVVAAWVDSSPDCADQVLVRTDGTGLELDEWQRNFVEAVFADPKPTQRFWLNRWTAGRL